MLISKSANGEAEVSYLMVPERKHTYIFRDDGWWDPCLYEDVPQVWDHGAVEKGSAGTYFAAKRSEPTETDLLYSLFVATLGSLKPIKPYLLGRLLVGLGNICR